MQNLSTHATPWRTLAALALLLLAATTVPAQRLSLSVTVSFVEENTYLLRHQEAEGYVITSSCFKYGQNLPAQLDMDPEADRAWLIFTDQSQCEVVDVVERSAAPPQRPQEEQ